MIGAEAGETGSKLSAAIRTKGRGTQDFNADGLPDFILQQCRLGVYDAVLKEKGLSAHQAGIVRDYTVEWVNARVADHIRETGSAPKLSTGQLIGAEAGETTQKLDGAIKKKGRGSQNFNASSLPDFIRQQFAKGAYDAVLEEKGLTPVYNAASVQQKIKLVPAQKAPKPAAT